MALCQRGSFCCPQLMRPTHLPLPAARRPPPIRLQMTLLEWSNSAHDLVPISLHTFEKLPQITQGDLPRDFQPQLEVDPLSRCAVLLLPQATLAVLPFFQDQLDLDGLGLSGGLSGAFGSDQQRLQTFPYASSFIIDFNQQILNHLPSTSSETHPHHSIKSVTALKFLPGFSEPTLAVLYQTQFTWSARLENHTNTSALIVLTLDLGSNHFPIISHTQNLPYDAHALVACPKELAGVLVLCADMLLHVDQSSKIIGVATNGWVKHTTDLQVPRQKTVQVIAPSAPVARAHAPNPSEPLPGDLEDGEEQDDKSSLPEGHERLLIRLENSKVVYCRQDYALMFLRNGQVFGLQFDRDGRTLTQLTLHKYNVRSIAPSTVVKLSDACLFVGSMCGDSALYALDQVQREHPAKTDPNQSQVTKASTNLDMDEDIYGERMDIQHVHSNDPSQPSHIPHRNWRGDGRNSGLHHATNFFPRLSDVIQSHGPIRDFAMASTGGGEDMPLELLACTGADDSGGLTVFYREMPLRKRRNLPCNGSSSQPTEALFSTSVLTEDCGNLEEKQLIWMVKSDHRTEIATCGESNDLVLVTTFQDTTLAASPFFDRRFIVQVTDTAIKLFTSGLKQVQVVQPEPSVKIKRASVVDDYVLLDSDCGLKLLYQGDLDSKSLRKLTLPPNHHDVHHATVLKAALPVYRALSSPGTRPSISKLSDRNDGEHFLYSHRGPQQHLTDTSGDSKTQPADSSLEGVLDRQSVAEGCTEKCWLLTTTKDGSFHIRTLPSLEIIFSTPRIDILPETISDDDKVKTDSHPVEFFGSIDEPVPNEPIAHIFSFLTGATISRPHLAVTLRNGAFAVYEILTSYPVPVGLAEKQGHPAVLLKKVLAHQFEGLDYSEDASSTSMQIDNTNTTMHSLTWSVTPVKKREKFKGVFVSSKPQIWLLSTDHGSCRIYNSPEDGKINGITQVTPNEDLLISYHYDPDQQNLKNASAPASNVISHHHRHDKPQEETREEPGGIWETFISDFICFDREIASCLVKTGRGFNKVVYDSYSDTIVGASYLETEFANFDEEGKLMWEPDDDSLVRPTTFRSSLELILPGSWVTIDGYEFQQNEWVTSMASVDLDSRSTVQGRRQFIGVGTTCNRAEDLASRGGVYVFEVIRVDPFSKRHPEYNRSLRLHYFEETKACVSAVDAINGYFLHTMGQKLYAKCFEQDERLLAVGFLDIKPYGTCLRVFKNFILLGDAVKGITLVAFQEEPYKLIELGHTYVDLKCSTVDFLVIDAKLAIVATDLNGIIRIFEYNPTNIESQAGQKLLCRTEFNTGSEMACSMQFGRRLSQNEQAKVMGTLFASFDGSISSLVPAKEAVYKRLQLVQTRLTRHVQHFAGLNPKGHRTVRNDMVSRAINRGILDGELLAKFELLSISQQIEIAGLAGSDRETVLVNLSNLRSLW